MMHIQSSLGFGIKAEVDPCGAVPDEVTCRKAVSSAQILAHVRLHDPSRIPRIVLAIGPCRCGTTAFLRVFAESGMTAFSQPLKGIHRHLAKGRPSDGAEWVVPSDPWFFMKETTGPFSKAEANLNFLALCVRILAAFEPKPLTEAEILARARAHLHVIVMARWPLDAWQSWKASFENMHATLDPEESRFYHVSRADLMETFLLAYENIDRMADEALGCRIPVSYYMTEANFEPATTMEALFKRIGIPAIPRIDGWGDASLIGAKGSRVVLDVDHIAYLMTGMFDTVNGSTSLAYRAGMGHLASEYERRVIANRGIFDIYSRFRHRGEETLGVNIPCIHQTP
jgi:hypothetical protein